MARKNYDHDTWVREQWAVLSARLSDHTGVPADVILAWVEENNIGCVQLRDDLEALDRAKAIRTMLTTLKQEGGEA